MYYRLGERVRMEKKLKGKPDVWAGMTGRIAHITTPKSRQDIIRNYGFGWMYGVELDEPDVNGTTKILFWTNGPNEPNPIVTRLDNPELHPKFLNYRKFNFSNE